MVLASGKALPDASTIWTANRDVLSPGAPVTFTWDNGQGLLFSRQMAIDENYLFTITDAVRNDTGATLASVAPVSLRTASVMVNR